MALGGYSINSVGSSAGAYAIVDLGNKRVRLGDDQRVRFQPLSALSDLGRIDAKFNQESMPGRFD